MADETTPVNPEVTTPFPIEIPVEEPVPEVVEVPAEDNVVDLFSGKKMYKKAMKHLEQGRDITKGEALGALVEIRDTVHNLSAILPSMGSDLLQLRDAVQFVLQQIHMVKNILVDKNILTEEEFQGYWKKFILDPMEAARKTSQGDTEAVIAENIENLKKFSAEDALFVSALEAVRKHSFLQTVIDDKDYTPDMVKDYWVGKLLDESQRAQAFDELSKYDIKNFPKKTEEIPIEKPVE